MAEEQSAVVARTDSSLPPVQSSELDGLSVEGFEALLKEVVDHTRPYSDKCELAQRLKKEQTTNKNKNIPLICKYGNGSEKGPPDHISHPRGSFKLPSNNNYDGITTPTTGKGPQCVEMRELGQRAQYLRYSANGTRESTSPTDSGMASGVGDGMSATEVDTTVSFSALGDHPEVNHLAKMRELSNHVGYEDGGDRMLNSDVSDVSQQALKDFNSPTCTSTTSATTAMSVVNIGGSRENKSRRRKERENSSRKLAETIPGHMGDKDVEYLAEYVMGEPSNQKNSNSKGANSLSSLSSAKSAAATRNKREKNGDSSTTPASNSTVTTTNNVRERKRTDRSSSPRSIGSSNSRVSPPEEEARDTFSSNHRITYGQVTSPPTSPRLAPSASSFAGFPPDDDITDDDEKGYQSDQGMWQEARRKRRQFGDKQAHADRQTRRSLPSKAKSQTSFSGQQTSNTAASTTTTNRATTTSTTTTPSVTSTTVVPFAPQTAAVPLPPVVMFNDDTKNCTPSTANFTFGFFDEVIPAKEEEPAPAPPSMQTIESKHKSCSKPPCPVIDFDIMKTFNYHEIVNHLIKEWQDSIKCLSTADKSKTLKHSRQTARSRSQILYTSVNQ